MLNDLLHLVTTHTNDIVVALEEHILLSLAAILIAAVIAVPLAIGLMNHRRAGEVVLQIAGVIQTIPSLAVLGVLIPFVGIGTIPAIIALVLYAIMPIFQNTYAGLTEIDANLLEAAEAFGFSRRFKLFKIQLPLAMPMILSGLRIAMVMIIGTATLAALIGGGGLGSFIMIGIQTNDNAQLLLGAILSALLALVFSWLIKLIGRLSLKKMGILVAVFFVLLGGYFGGKTFMQPKGQITVAGKLGGEPEILINMYKDLIEADNPHLDVQLKPDFGGTTFIYKAVKSGDVDIYPEFTGTVLQNLIKGKTVSHQPKKAYQDAKEALNKQANLAYLPPMRYQNTYALAVRQSDAKKYNLKTTSDLAKMSSQLTAGFDHDFYELKDSYPGMKKAYQLQFKDVKSMSSSLRYKALANGQIDVTDAYTTDPQLKADKLVTLVDDKNYFPPFQGAPLVRKDILTKYPSVKKSLLRLKDKVTNQDMIDMNYQVTVEHKSADKVARQYLEKHDLLK